MPPAHLPVRYARKRVRTLTSVAFAALMSFALLGLNPSSAQAAPIQSQISTASMLAVSSKTSAAPKIKYKKVSVKTPSIKRKAKKRVTNKVMGAAASRQGTPYRWGGTTTAGFDCSGYTRWVFKRVGVTLPRTSAAQAGAVTRVKNPAKGDLVFFHGGGRVYHVGIYAGGNKIWHSPYTGAKVRKERIWTSAVTFGRVKGVSKAVTKEAKKLVKKKNAAAYKVAKKKAVLAAKQAAAAEAKRKAAAIARANAEAMRAAELAAAGTAEEVVETAVETVEPAPAA